MKLTKSQLKELVKKSIYETLIEADEDEEITVERIPISRVSQLIKLGEIQDAKTVAIILMATNIF